MKDFFKSQFGVIMLLCLAVGLLVSAWFGFRYNLGDFASFCQTKSGEVIAAILALLVQAGRTRLSDNGGNHAVPNQAPNPPAAPRQP